MAKKPERVKIGLDVAAEVAEAFGYWSRRTGLSQHKLLRLLLEIGRDELAKRYPEKKNEPLIPPGES